MSKENKNIVVLSGAGVSAESGIQTFRGSDGLWEGHDIMEVASPIGFAKNPALVLEFYNLRRRKIKEVKPNKAHFYFAALEKQFNVNVITQNIDNLHERGGSTKVLHLHGEIMKVRSTLNPNHIVPWQEDLVIGNECPKGGQLRPHIVWFGEEVPEIENAIPIIQAADYLIVVGTSLAVYPAASLVNYTNSTCKVIIIDPNMPEIHLNRDIFKIQKPATDSIEELDNFLNN